MSEARAHPGLALALDPVATERAWYDPDLQPLRELDGAEFARGG